MKYPTLAAACIFTLTSAMSTSAFAERSQTQQAFLEGGTFVGTTVAATVAGGPVGFVVGAISGAFLAKQTRVANESQLALTNQEKELDDLEAKMLAKDEQISDLEAEIIEKLAFEVLFATGEDRLNDLDKRRVRILAYYLSQNPALTVSLNGHADPRGTDEYNNVLSIERANAIKKELILLGIDETRIKCNGFGTQFSTAEKGDFDSYAKERRVDIFIEPEDDALADSATAEFATTP